MRIRPFTPRESITDIQTTSQEWRVGSELGITHDDLYARACESDIDRTISDNDLDEPSPHNTREVTMDSDHTNAETCRTSRDDSQRFFPQRTNCVTERIRIHSWNLVQK